MDNVTRRLTGPLVRPLLARLDEVNKGAPVLVRPPTGFLFVRTVSDTRLRDASGGFIITPGVAT